MTEEKILEFISRNKKTEPEELFGIRKDCYLLSVIIFLHFGFKEGLYKEPLLLLKEYIKIIEKEIRIYDYIIINLEKLNLDRTAELLADIDDIHDSAYNRLDKDLKDMEDALDINDTNRIKRSKYIDFNITFDDYYNSLGSLNH